MSNNPPTSRTARWIYRSVFIAFGGLLIGVTYWQGKQNIDEQNRVKTEARAEQQRIEGQYNQVQGKLDGITQFVAHPPLALIPNR